MFYNFYCLDKAEDWGSVKLYCGRHKKLIPCVVMELSHVVNRDWQQSLMKNIRQVNVN